ncbi:MAG: lytic transglycosylase domain-containing protein [Silicimonas sp.]|jgi:soluble lytic murein transglycosylase-like protein|nr:lytic transglycosylase domain-containing protein [Silicimonas sp.]
MFRFAAAVLACLTLAVPSPVFSADLKARMKLFERQTAILDKKTAARRTAPVALGPANVFIPGVPSSEFIPRFNAGKRSQYEGEARKAARRHNVPEDLFLRLVSQESGWNPSARSHKGAIGLAQLMPGTAAKLRVNPHDPHQNLDGGARYLAEQYRVFRSWRLALAAYNAGPAAVEKYNGVPPYKETRGYVRAILGG